MSSNRRRQAASNHDHIPRALVPKSRAFLRATEELVRIRHVLRELQVHSPGVHAIAVREIIAFLELMEQGLVSDLSQAIGGASSR